MFNYLCPRFDGFSFCSNLCSIICVQGLMGFPHAQLGLSSAFIQGMMILPLLHLCKTICVLGLWFFLLFNCVEITSIYSLICFPFVQLGSSSLCLQFGGFYSCSFVWNHLFFGFDSFLFVHLGLSNFCIKV